MLKLFVAFWAAEMTEEKKPLAEGVLGPLGPFSGVGVRGARVKLESLLGTSEAEPARLRRCASMLLLSELGEEPPEPKPWLWLPESRDEAAAVCGRVTVVVLRKLGSVGVGGVLTMTGGEFSAVAGGVSGRARVSTF